MLEILYYFIVFFHIASENSDKLMHKCLGLFIYLLLFKTIIFKQ